jgi:hypothetical protein
VSRRDLLDAQDLAQKLVDALDDLGDVQCDDCDRMADREKKADETAKSREAEHAQDVRRLVLWAVEHGARLDSLPARLSPEAQDAAKAAWLSGVA